MPGSDTQPHASLAKSRTSFFRLTRVAWSVAQSRTRRPSSSVPSTRRTSHCGRRSEVAGQLGGTASLSGSRRHCDASSCRAVARTSSAAGREPDESVGDSLHVFVRVQSEIRRGNRESQATRSSGNVALMCAAVTLTAEVQWTGLPSSSPGSMPAKAGYGTSNEPAYKGIAAGCGWA